MRSLPLIALGGALGAVARYLAGGAVHRLFPDAAFPVGTLAVNVSGCLLIGFLGGLAESRQVLGPEVRLFLLVGLLGGFTTFSSFGYETLALARDAEMGKALLNVAASVALGLAAVWAGDALARAL
jgi:fluoride exporter